MIASPPKASSVLLASPLVVEAPTKLNACPISFRVQGGTGGFARRFRLSFCICVESVGSRTRS